MEDLYHFSGIKMAQKKAFSHYPGRQLIEWPGRKTRRRYPRRDSAPL